MHSSTQTSHLAYLLVSLRRPFGKLGSCQIVESYDSRVAGNRRYAQDLQSTLFRLLARALIEARGLGRSPLHQLDRPA